MLSGVQPQLAFGLQKAKKVDKIGKENFKPTLGEVALQRPTAASKALGEKMYPHVNVEAFAKEWVEAWNSHKLDAILSHYADNVEFTSPFIVRLMNETSGTITGKEKLKPYFEKGLAAYPDLHFKLMEVLERGQQRDALLP